MEATSKPYDFSKLPESFQSLIKNPELAFQFFDLLPTPIEIWDAEGTTTYKSGLHGNERC